MCVYKKGVRAGLSMVGVARSCVGRKAGLWIRVQRESPNVVWEGQRDRASSGPEKSKQVCPPPQTTSNLQPKQTAGGPRG